MNILILGKDGQLGKAFQAQFKHSEFQRGDSLYFTGRSECDLSESGQVTNLLNAFNPHLIINASAYTVVDKAESEPEMAFAINTNAIEEMAIYAAQNSATLLHFSTDYVFDGSKQGAYTEMDQTRPLSVYGKSKESGEQAIVKAFAAAANQESQYAILRTSWVYGDGKNFIRTILRLAKERAALRVVDDQHGVPTSAEWLAEVACSLALDDGKLRKFTSGIYHAVPPGETSWYGLARLVVQTALDSGQHLQVSPMEITPIPASEYPLPAPRPMNSRLSADKLRIELERLGIVSKLPHWNTPWDEQVSTYVNHLFIN
jgi:dTDP-4-dehydrorhamnose reductase